MFSCIISFVSATFAKVLDLIEKNSVQISAHGYDELTEDNILIRDVLAGVTDAVTVEVIPIIIEVPACWYCRKMGKVDRSMFSGVFRKALHSLPCW